MTACPLCAGSVRIAGYRGLNLLYKCKSCSTMFQEPIPSYHALDGCDPDHIDSRPGQSPHPKGDWAAMSPTEIIKRSRLNKRLKNAIKD
jgi:hypothetical protein